MAKAQPTGGKGKNPQPSSRKRKKDGKQQIVRTIEAERERLTKIIAVQNDSFRQTWGANFTIPGRILFTPGVCNKGGLFMQAAMLAIMVFDRFTEDNDPSGAHSFGTVEVEGQRILWKINLYDPDYRDGSERPHDPKVTRRVLTVMLPEEY